MYQKINNFSGNLRYWLKLSILNSAEPMTPFSDFYQSQLYLKNVSRKFLRFFGKRLLYNKMLTSGDLIVLYNSVNLTAVFGTRHAHNALGCFAVARACDICII